MTSGSLGISPHFCYADAIGRQRRNPEFCHAHAGVRVARAAGLKVYDDRGDLNQDKFKFYGYCALGVIASRKRASVAATHPRDVELVRRQLA
jgi:hypothetical protein